MKTPVAAGAFFLSCARAFLSCLGLWTGRFLNLYPNLDPPLLEKRNDHIVQPVIWKGEIAEKLAGWVFQIQSVPVLLQFVLLLEFRILLIYILFLYC